jgi:hypothetical protein
MPSPFPGMDPWLEDPGVFPDFHNTFIPFLRIALQRQLPAGFVAVLATRVYMQDTEQQFEPDIDVVRQRSRPGRSADGTATMAVTDLLELPAGRLPDDEYTEPHIEVRTTHGDRRLVTSIEVLSLANKTRGNTGRGLYRGKQQELAKAGVNLVEIDLLRGGIHSTAVALPDLRGRAGPYDYHVCVTWVEREDTSYVAPILLAEPLPTIPIPLTPGVPSPAIDLQAVLTRVYDEADYGRIVDYKTPCDPPLTSEQQAWAEGLLRARGLIQ